MTECHLHFEPSARKLYDYQAGDGKGALKFTKGNQIVKTSFHNTER